jgi:hypothetical protein
MIDRNTNVQITDEALAFAKPMLSAGLSRTQLIILGLCRNYGAEIQVHYENERYCYTLVEEGGDTSPIRKDTFWKLCNANEIKLNWRPSIDVERWS